MKLIVHFFLSSVILFFSLSLTFAQSIQNDSLHHKSYSNYKFFTLHDSVNTITNVYNNKAANKAFTNGLIWAAIGAGVGLSTAALNIIFSEHCDLGCGLAIVALPILFGGVGFISGSTISYFIHYDDRNTFINYPYSKMRFKHRGINAIFSVPKYGYGKTSLGISYRNLREEFYLPTKLTLLIGFEPHGYYLYKKNLPDKFDDSFSYITSNEINFGLSAVHVNYNSVFSFLYGLEFGMNYATAKILLKTEEDYQNVPYLKLFLPYIDLMVGFNINLFSFLSWDAAYVYEPYGIYPSLKPANHSIKTYQWKINSSLSFYF